jgi:hypothetical protein
MAGLIRVGTATFTNNSANVVGIGTNWTTTVRPGALIWSNFNRLPYEVLTVNSDTSLTLSENWSGTTGTYGYAVQQWFGAQDDAPTAISTQIALFLAAYGELFSVTGNSKTQTFNKGTVGSNAGPVLQVAGVGYFRLGMFGDGVYRLERSADGTNWTTVYSVNRSTGAITVTGATEFSTVPTVGGVNLPRLNAFNTYTSAQGITAAYAAWYYNTTDSGSTVETVYQRNGVTRYTIAHPPTGGMLFAQYNSSGVLQGNDIAIAANGVVTLRSGMVVGGNLNVVASGSVAGGSISFGTSAAGVLSVPTDGSRLDINPAAFGSVRLAGNLRLTGYGAGTLITDASGNVTASSDERLKENIQPFTAGLEDLVKVNPIAWNWNGKSGFDRLNIYCGYSAQNLQAANPSFVSMGANGYLNPNYPAISASQTNSIKELAAKIEALSTRLAALENA